MEQIKAISKNVALNIIAGTVTFCALTPALLFGACTMMYKGNNEDCLKHSFTNLFSREDLNSFLQTIPSYLTFAAAVTTSYCFASYYYNRAR